MELENRCSNLLLLVVDKRLPLFHLSCRSLVFRLMCCNVFSLKPTRPKCDGRTAFSPHGWSRRLFPRFPTPMGFSFCVTFLTRNVALHDPPSCSREDSLDKCERTHNTLSCLLFSALWLRCFFSILMQETHTAMDLDLTCFTTCLFNTVTSIPVGPTSLEWPIVPLARSDLSGFSLPPEVPSGEQLGALPVSTRSHWRQGAFHTLPQILQRTTGWDGCGPFLSAGLRCITWNRGLVRSVFSRQRNREFKLKYLKRLFDANNFYVSRRCMERTNIFRQFRCWLRDFDSLVLSFLTVKTREDRLSAFTGTFCLRVLLFHIWLLVKAVIIL